MGTKYGMGCLYELMTHVVQVFCLHDNAFFVVQRLKQSEMILNITKEKPIMYKTLDIPHLRNKFTHHSFGVTIHSSIDIVTHPSFGVAKHPST